MNSEKVWSVEKSPPEPPPHVNFKGVQSFCVVKFFRCFITKVSKTAQALARLLLTDVIFYFSDACLETFCWIKTTPNYTFDTLRGGQFMIEKVDIPPSP